MSLKERGHFRQRGFVVKRARKVTGRRGAQTALGEAAKIFDVNLRGEARAGFRPRAWEILTEKKPALRKHAGMRRWSPTRGKAAARYM